MSSSSVISRDAAATFGELHGRSISRVLGDGLADVFGSRSGEGATEVVHVGMALAPMMVGTSPRITWGHVAFYGGPTFLALWASGQSQRVTTRYSSRWS